MKHPMTLILVGVVIQACAGGSTPAQRPQPPPVSKPAGTEATQAAPGRAPSAPVSPELLARRKALMDEADAAYASQDYERAATSMQEAAELGDARAHYNLGVMAEENDAVVIAQEHFLEAARLDPSYGLAILQLARGDAEGWGRKLDYGRAAQRFDTLTRHADPLTRGFAHVNLGMFALHGLGREHSLSDARKHLEAATQLGVAEAQTLLSGLPRDLTVWPGALPEPDHGRPKVYFDSRPGEYGSRPTWVVENSQWRAVRLEPPLRGTYVAEQRVALGVPGRDATTDAPASMTYTATFSWSFDGRSAAYLSMETWHTNQHHCELGGFVVAREGGDWVLLINDAVEATDGLSGETRRLDGCYLKTHVEGQRISFNEDWPRGCSLLKCTSRGTIVGRTYALNPTDLDPRDIEAEQARRTFERLYARAPAWTRPDAQQTRRQLPRYTGLWRSPHTIDATGEDGEAQVQSVTDVLRICSIVEGEASFTLDNFVVEEHGCSVQGKVAFNSDGELLLISDASNWLELHHPHSVSGLRCTLRVAVKDSKIVIGEVWPEDCSFDGCGARAHPSYASFPTKRRDARGCKKPYRSPWE